MPYLTNPEEDQFNESLITLLNDEQVIEYDARHDM